MADAVRITAIALALVLSAGVAAAADRLSFAEEQSLSTWLREALDYSAAIVETTHEPLLVLDSELRVVSANRAFREKFDLDSAAIEGRPVYDMDGRRWNIPALRDLLARVTTDRGNVEDYVVEHEFPGLGRRSLCGRSPGVADQHVGAGPAGHGH